MTFREKLKTQYPEAISDKYLGGCLACPYHYGYEAEYTEDFKDEYCRVRRCEDCWNRECEGNK